IQAATVRRAKARLAVRRDVEAVMRFSFRGAAGCGRRALGWRSAPAEGTERRPRRACQKCKASLTSKSRVLDGSRQAPLTQQAEEPSHTGVVLDRAPARRTRAPSR